MGGNRNSLNRNEESPEIGAEYPDISKATKVEPVPVFAGERKIAVQWMTGNYRIYTELAPNPRPGKK